MQSNPLFSRTKADAPPLVDAQGQPLAVEPRKRSWCRIQLTVSMEPPRNGRVWDVSRGPYSTRLMLFAPAHVLYGLWIAFMGSVPWVRDLAVWCLAHLK